MYTTHQRKILLSYLSQHADQQLSADDITNALSDEGISRSAVYRNLADLESEGKLHRLTKEGSRKILYQFIGAEKCKNELHLACKKCGKTIHMDHETAEKLVESVAGGQNFRIDVGETVLYGTCENCSKGDNNEKN